MPYIDSTPRDYPIVFEEDNIQEVFGQMLTNNGWVKVKRFYKAAVDSRAYKKKTDRVNYAIAKHEIFKNADGVLLGFATVGQFNLKFRQADIHPIRRVDDDLDPNDPNFGMVPSWRTWIVQKLAETVTKTNMYFYMLEKLPNGTLVEDGGLVSMVTMPGMSRTAYDLVRDRDSKNWSRAYYGNGEFDYSGEDEEMSFDGKLMTASPYHLARSVLDIEVFGTEWIDDTEEVMITLSDPNVMQSPITKVTLRAEFLDHVEDPIWHTNWWTDSEVSIRGHVDSRTIFLIIQADNAPAWENNTVPTIPLYFGKINSLTGNEDEGYALFSGTIPPYKRKNYTESTTLESSTASSSIVNGGTRRQVSRLRVDDATKLPNAPALLTLGGEEIVKLLNVDGNIIEVERAHLGTKRKAWTKGTIVARLSTNNDKIDNELVVALYDFDDPGATVGEIMHPLLKLYPSHPSNGVDNVMVSRSRFGARYQAHYLSWNAPPNLLPPTRMSNEGKKYHRAYNSPENTENYKYQFNPSRYSGKIHSSRIYVVHPEEGVRGYLDKAIGFNSQSVNASNLRVRKQDCPEKEYEMYKYLDIGAVSPLTKLPATPFRPVGLGIYSNDFKPNEEPWDIENDATPPGEVTITSVVSPHTMTLDVRYEVPDDKDFYCVNIYVDDKLYAKGITRTTFYRITGLTTGFKPKVRVTTVDLAGNESTGIEADAVQIK